MTMVTDTVMDCPSGRIADALAIFHDGYNCAQSVLYAFRQECGLPEDAALKIACGFGSGIARTGKLCGALSGGIMVLGLRHGRGLHDDRSARDMTYSRTTSLLHGFIERHGSADCRELLGGLDLSVETGRSEFRQSGMLEKVCSGCVAGVVELLEKDDFEALRVGEEVSDE
jgi:C_GCAxxG_C_C family probable redox protein